MNGDLSVQILRDIRDAVRETNTRLDETNIRLDETNTRVEEFSRRVVESELRTATAITDLHGTVRDLVTVLREQHDLRPRVQRCEEQIAALQRRLPG